MGSSNNNILKPFQITPNSLFTQGFLSRFYRDPSSIIAFFIFIIICMTTFFAPWISDGIFHSNPNNQSILNKLAPWFSEGHFLGTDELGRDVLTRTLFAGRTSLAIGLGVAFLQSFIGISLGVIAGYYGAFIDDSINALFLSFRSIPIFFILIIFSVLFRPSVFGIIIILGSLGWTGVYRQVRGMILSVKSKDYVDAARALGATDIRIIFTHLIPNIASIVLINFSFDVAGAIITESSLSFLGFGVPPPTPSWGNMLSNALDNISTAPWLTITPGLMITISVFVILLLSDGLRDALDPTV
jgi:peptide/nickel transport system permease protein